MQSVQGSRNFNSWNSHINCHYPVSWGIIVSAIPSREQKIMLYIISYIVLKNRMSLLQILVKIKVKVNHWNKLKLVGWEPYYTTTRLNNKRCISTQIPLPKNGPKSLKTLCLCNHLRQPINLINDMLTARHIKHCMVNEKNN